MFYSTSPRKSLFEINGNIPNISKDNLTIIFKESAPYLYNVNLGNPVHFISKAPHTK
jgi:hypothetical protein